MKKYIAFALLLVFYFYVSWIVSMFWFILTLIFYGSIIYLIRGIFKRNYKIFSKENYQDFLEYFIQRVSIFVLVMIGTLWSFAYYQNDVSPATMPTYTISNGEKTVIFQAMSHIWSQNFYDTVRENILQAKNEGFVYYYEWVRPGSQENEEKFNNALWVEFDASLYENMSKLYGLVAQDNRYFLWLWDTPDKNVDVSLDEVIEKYESIKSEKNIQREYTQALPVSEVLFEQLNRLNEREITILRYVNKAMVNMIIKNSGFSDIMIQNFSNQELFAVILNKRDEVLAQEIITSEDQKIITTYGLLHFQWVLDILQKSDIKWQITKIQSTPVTK